MLTHLISTYGYTAIFFLMALQSAAIPLPSEVILPFAGFLVASGHYTLLSMVLVATAGSLVGSLVLYCIGYYGGRPVLERYGKYILMSSKDIDRGEQFFAKHGNAANFFGRLIPVVRTFISFPAGVSREKIAPFIIYAIAGSFIWSLALTWIGEKLGQNWGKAQHFLHGITLIVVVGIVLWAVWYIYKRRKRAAALRQSVD